MSKAKAQTKTKTKATTKTRSTTKARATATGTAKARGTSRASEPRKAASKARGAIETPVKEDWRGETLTRMRALIFEADPEMSEERKWRKPSNGMAGVPVWSHDGIVCTGESYAKAVKLTFARGASLPDPAGLFNASLDGGTRRAIDIPEGQKVDARAFKALVKAAVALNASAKKR